MVSIAVVGGGAIGGLFGAALAQSGNDVLLVDVSEPLVTHIQNQGLTIERNGKQVVHKVKATTDASRFDPVEVIFVFVKGYHTELAISQTSAIRDDRTIIVTLQNGWGNADVIAQTCEMSQILVGITNNSATVRNVGHVAHTGSGPTYVGPFDTNAGTDHALKVAQLLSSSGLATEMRENIKQEIWRKLVLNAATLPTAALTGMTAGELGEPGPMRDLVDAVAAETVSVANAHGFNLDVGERVAYIHSLLAGAGVGKASMLQDFEAGRRTEIETINGAVARMADAAKVDVPLNKALVALVKGYERVKGF